MRGVSWPVPGGIPDGLIAGRCGSRIFGLDGRDGFVASEISLLAPTCLCRRLDRLRGAVESICVGEIKLSLRKSLVKLGCSFISRDPKLQFLISDLEIVMRPQGKRTKKSTSKKPRSSGRGKWMIVTNVARFLSVSVMELVVKVPQATIEVKDLKLDICKSGGPVPILSVKVQLLPISIQASESHTSCEQSSNSVIGGSALAGKSCTTPFICEELSLMCEFAHERELGFMTKNVEVASGEVAIDLSEVLFLKKSIHSETSVSDGTDAGDSESSEATVESSKPSKKGQKLTSAKKIISGFPEKVKMQFACMICFTLFFFMLTWSVFSAYIFLLLVVCITINVSVCSRLVYGNLSKSMKYNYFYLQNFKPYCALW
ncbi:SABRE protein [Nymphaea thermarum]|nr:SABRE protein [Nymphaea thermarum]